MKRRSFFYSLAAGVVVLLLIGIGGYYWLISQSPLGLLQGGSQTTPTAAIFVTKQAPAMVSLLVNPDRLESLQKLLVRPGERRRSHQELNQLKNSLLANTDLDYQRDIQPWLGEEITLAVTSTDIDRNQQNGQQPGYLMALTSKDAEKSREFLQLLFSQQAITGAELISEQYKGVNIVSYSTQNSKLKTQNYLSGAVIGDSFVLFANHPKVLRDAINNVQAGDLSLTSSSQYQQALELLPSRRIGLAFFNLPGIAAWLGHEQTNLTYGSQIIALELNRQGLLAKTSLIAAPNQEIAVSAPNLAEPVKALQYIPAATGFSISGSDLSQLKNTDLNQLWTQVSAVLSGSDKDAISRLFNQPLAALQARWGIDLPQDIFNWVQGEYALGLLPQKLTNADWIFVAEKSAATEQGLSRLDTIAQKQGLSITKLSIGKQPISAWTELITTPTSSFTADTATIALKAKVYGVYTTVDNYEIFTTSVEAMDAALKAANNDSLTNSGKFQASVDAIPQPNEGYVYLDWKATQEILERQLPVLKLLEVIGKPFFDNLRSLTVSSYGSETGILKGSVFFKFDSSVSK